MQFYVWSLWMKFYATTINCMEILSAQKILWPLKWNLLSSTFRRYYLLPQCCQNAPATGAIAGYFKVFAACKLLEKSEKMDD